MNGERQKKEDEEYVEGASGHTFIAKSPKSFSDLGQGTTDQQGHDSNQGISEQQGPDFTQGVDVGMWLHAERMKKKMLNNL